MIDLLTRINDLGNIRELISNLIIIILVDLSLGIIIMFVLFKISIKLSIIVIVALIIYILITFIFNKFVKKNIQEGFKVSSIVNNYIVESLSSFETIKNLSIQKYIYKKFVEKYDNYSIDLKHLIKKINQIND